MAEDFILRQLKKGIIKGYKWPVQDPSKVVCIIHGIGEFAERYDRVATKFNEAGFVVFMMDLRGHGKSYGRRGDCAPRTEVLEDVSALISHAKRAYHDVGLILYGHSMGGNIVLDYRMRGAFRDIPAGYLIASPWIRLVRSIPGAFYHFVKLTSHIGPTMTFGSDVDEKDLGNPESVLPYHDDPRVHNKISLRCAVEGYETGIKLEERARKMNRADSAVGDIPMMMMHGGQDRICDIEGTKKVFEGYKRCGENVMFKELPGIFHEAHNGGAVSNGDEVIDEMIEFIRSC